ncbi:MAG TPA: AAA family ATPase [Saprospiraceae bacterium]|nr:AAA family ATPase [Saprospiraceae bacterium]HMQ85863.1 AAA family ATPase [Saprospiraceae bacterium]
MERINYPILCYQLQPELVLGLLVGTEVEVLDKDTSSLKANVLDYLQKQYKKHDEFPVFDIVEPRLKMLEIPMRPAYRDRSGSYPFSQSVKVPVPVVFGETAQGNYECHLPLMGESFYYYDPKQFDALVRHGATSLLNQYPPEKLFRLVSYPTPTLETITLKVNYDRDFFWEPPEFQRTYKILGRLAERYPYPKHLRKNIHILPEAAWEMEEVVQTLIEKIVQTRSNVLVVGKQGVGKSAVLQQAIKKISSPAQRQEIGLSFWRIMSQRITASSKYLGEWEQMAEKLIEELSTANGILWVEDVIRLLEIGGEGPEDSMAAFFQYFLQQGRLQLLGECTPQELESIRRLLPGFAQSFQIVQIDELPEYKTIQILQRLAAFSEQNLKITIEEDALRLAYRLLLRYYPYESFPGKAIKFFSQCLNEQMLLDKSGIDKRFVIDTFVRQTGLPELFLRDDLILDTQELSHYFNSQIIGQPMAVNQLSSLVKIYKAGLNNPHKPIYTLLFAGPTGVGKTASCKALANYFFGKGQRKSPLIRIDMSEFQHAYQISRLIGARREPGLLVKEIRERPFSVLLLDEIEKADPSVFDTLLGVLDEGMMVDAFGRVTNFRNTIVIMTSNLGASSRQSIGFSTPDDENTAYHSAIARHFRPEFMNRIDAVVVFRPLDQQSIQEITLKELAEVKKREGITKRRLELLFADALIAHLSKVGFDVRYGARPLQRLIDQWLISGIANWILAHPEAESGQLTVGYEKEGLVFQFKGF